MIDQRLKEETEKWIDKIEKELESTGFYDEEGKEFLLNIHAYVDDSKYWLDQGDLIKAFEAIIWAWAWYEICLRLEILKNINKPEEEE